MPKASEIKKNTAIEYNGNTYIVRDIERSVPQGRAGGSIYRMRMYDVITNNKIDETFKDSDMLNLGDLIRRPVMFSYIDGDEHVFMDVENYTPYNLNKESIEDQILFFTETTEGMQVVIVNDSPVALDLPNSVELQVTETDPCRIKTTRASRYFVNDSIDDLYPVADTDCKNQKWHQHREDSHAISKQNQQAELPNNRNCRTEQCSNGRLDPAGIVIKQHRGN